MFPHLSTIQDPATMGWLDIGLFEHCQSTG
jgi:hypothetical protein